MSIEISYYITNEEFDLVLSRLVEKESDILSIPGAYEVMKEYFNNEVLDIWEQKQLKYLTQAAKEG